MLLTALAAFFSPAPIVEAIAPPAPIVDEAPIPWVAGDTSDTSPGAEHAFTEGNPIVSNPPSDPTDITGVTLPPVDEAPAFEYEGPALPFEGYPEPAPEVIPPAVEPGGEPVE